MNERDRWEEREDEPVAFEMGKITEETAGFPGGSWEDDEPLPI